MSDFADTRPRASEPDAGSAFRFTGTWQEYLPIAVTNLLLTVVTLGVYRFWARARERRYLWSRTQFIDDHLEWAGTGLEMFIGFLLVIVILIPFLLLFQFGVQALAFRGQFLLAGLATAALYLSFLYLAGLAFFRALRYRLSRTFWHGIRGGSDDAGWTYAWSSVWKTIAGTLIFGLLIPWSLCELWNDRWNRMSFGPHRFSAAAETRGLMGRWLLIYAVPIAGLLGGGLLAAALFANAGTGGAFATGVVAVIAVYVLVLLAGVAFYAKFYRQAIAATRLGPLGFAFNARTADWYKLIFGTLGLIIVTLGFGLMFVAYRNWSFFVRHLEASGEIDLDELTQSQTRADSDAEGLASAFDIGAI